MPSLAPAAPAALGQDRWHPDIPAAAEVITGGSARLLCAGGPLVVVGAEPGDVIVVDVLAAGTGGAPAPSGHPALIGCAPGPARGARIGSCAIARLTAGARVLLPVHVPGAELSVGGLHLPSAVGECRPVAEGWIDLRVNLTRRGVERFGVSGPILMTSPL
ncbi:acetamidase/formamidase family protein [Actinomadura hibisca]|uniref:acetamidase/formamidase family protein n=1 Tax=Actinomadura hibisca TaxID=68565 RepID=UPI00082CC865|nr:acetamidase/formamidase family protein [Actinomadura hibisca]